MELTEDSKRDYDFVSKLDDTDAAYKHSDVLSATEVDNTSKTSNFHVNGSLDMENSPSSALNKPGNAFLDSWRANFEASIKARDEKEAVKRAELEATAKRVPNLFSSNYFHLEVT